MKLNKIYNIYIKLYTSKIYTLCIKDTAIHSTSSKSKSLIPATLKAFNKL